MLCIPSGIALTLDIGVSSLQSLCELLLVDVRKGVVRDQQRVRYE
jgi:hypothetical protein